MFILYTIFDLDQIEKMSSYLPGVLLLDLHGHGHNHDFIEVGYRLTADILNAISDPQVKNRIHQNGCQIIF